VRPTAPSALRLSRYAVLSLVLGIVCVLWMCLVADAAFFGPVPEPLKGWGFLFLICGGPLAALCAVAAIALGATARQSERRRLAIAGIVLGVCFVVPALIYAAFLMFVMVVFG